MELNPKILKRALKSRWKQNVSNIKSILSDSPCRAIYRIHFIWLFINLEFYWFRFNNFLFFCNSRTSDTLMLENSKTNADRHVTKTSIVTFIRVISYIVERNFLKIDIFCSRSTFAGAISFRYRDNLDEKRLKAKETDCIEHMSNSSERTKRISIASYEVVKCNPLKQSSETNIL